MIIPVRFYQGQPATSSTVLMTVPQTYLNHSIQQFVIKQVLLCNTTSSGATITLNIVASGSTASVSNEVYGGLTVPANSTTSVGLSQAMVPGDFLAGLQGTSGAITVTASGSYHT